MKLQRKHVAFPGSFPSKAIAGSKMGSGRLDNHKNENASVTLPHFVAHQTR